MIWSHGEVYSIQHYVIQFVSDLRQVDEFSPVLLFTPPIKIDRHDIKEEFLLCTYVTRIIQSLYYYSPASRCINSSSSSESADRGRSIIQVMYVRGYLQGSENGRVVTITIHRSYF